MGQLKEWGPWPGESSHQEPKNVGLFPNNKKHTSFVHTNQKSRDTEASGWAKSSASIMEVTSTLSTN